MANPLYTSRSEDERTTARHERKPMSKRKKTILYIALAAGAAFAAATGYVIYRGYKTQESIQELNQAIHHTDLVPFLDGLRDSAFSMGGSSSGNDKNSNNSSGEGRSGEGGLENSSGSSD